MPFPTSNTERTFGETKYAEIIDEEDDIDSLSSVRGLHAPVKRPFLALIQAITKKRYIAAAAAAASVILILAGILYLVIHTHHHALPSAIGAALTQTDCGTTSAEAKAHGCTYEPMQRSWIPPACYFPEPSEDYHPFDDREWYADEQMTQLVNAAQMQLLRTGGDFMAYTKYFHHEHCLYAWRKMAIAVDMQKPMIDTKTANLHHTTHCAKIIAQMIVEAETHTFNNSESFTFSPLMFQTCVALDWKQ